MPGCLALGGACTLTSIVRKIYPETCTLRPEGKCHDVRRLEATCLGTRHLEEI